MNKIYLTFLLGLFAVFSVFDLSAQAVGGGRVEARFGVDGELTADTALFGGASSVSPFGKPSDDWFKFGLSGNGIGVIDTTGAYGLKLLMQSSATTRDTLTFAMPMAVPKLTRSGGYILLDALYAKDYFDADRTVITSSGTKSVDDPNSWTISSGSVQSKDEIMEFYSHVRRKGQTVSDSLFFYFGVGIHGTTGDKNVAAELFVNDVKLNTGTGKLTNLGADGGRVAWLFDAAGNVVRVGDMVISMSYNPGGAGSFNIEPRIWVHDSSRKTGVGAPLNFVWGTNFDKQNTSSFGFADIVPLSGSSFAQGAANSASTPTTMAAPWGTVESGASHNWQAFYDAEQFVEVSINLTTLGVDPALFNGIDPCTVPFRTIVFRSRSATAFNSNLADFAGPYPFWRYPRVISSIKGKDTLTCVKTTGSVYADSAYSLAWYKWTAIDGGNITGYNPDSTVITFNQPGKYILETAPLRGCFTKKDTITILQDIVKPIATAAAYDTLIDGSVYTVKLYGGDSLASVAATNSGIFGPSKGIGFSWTGPFGYAKTGMQPLASEIGRYYLTVTELRNGCTDTASTYLAWLPVEIAEFNCAVSGKTVQLDWKGVVSNEIKSFLIERINQSGSQLIAQVNAGEIRNIMRSWSYTDKSPAPGLNLYRLSAIDKQSRVVPLDYCSSSLLMGEVQQTQIYPNPVADELRLVMVPHEGDVQYQITDVIGKILMKGLLESNRLNVNRIPSGIFNITLIYNNTSETIRFIK